MKGIVMQCTCGWSDILARCPRCGAPPKTSVTFKSDEKRIAELEDGSRESDKEIVRLDHRVAELEGLYEAARENWKMLAELNESLRADRERHLEIMETAAQALDDWTCTYAHELAGKRYVEAARKRIREGGGTLAYIGDIRQTLREAIDQARKEEND